MDDPKKPAADADQASKAAIPSKATTTPKAPKNVLSTTKRVKMHTSTAGFKQVPDLDEKGAPKFSPTTGKQLMKNGSEFVWNPHQEYDLPTDEADRYIELGYASEVAAKAA